MPGKFSTTHPTQTGCRAVERKEPELMAHPRGIIEVEVLALACGDIHTMPVTLSIPGVARLTAPHVLEVPHTFPDSRHSKTDPQLSGFAVQPCGRGGTVVCG